MWSVKKGKTNNREYAFYQCTKVHWQQYLHFPNMGGSGGPPDGARVVQHVTDKLRVQQNSIPDGQQLLFRRVPRIPSLCASFFLA
jgi:hypothetical protein